MSQLGVPLQRNFPPEKTESRAHWWEVMPKCHWELMNLNETGCKARIPVAILYGACGPAKASDAPFWVIWRALRRYERKDCDVNFEFRRRPRLVYRSSPMHQGEALFTEGSQVCIVLWCHVVVGLSGQLSGPSGRERAGTWVCLSRDHQELDQVGEGGWIFTTPASCSSAHHSEYCSGKVQASSHLDAFRENTAFLSPRMLKKAF